MTRASEGEAAEKLRRAGAHTVLSPFSITGHRLANALPRPFVVTFLESATMELGLDVSIEQIPVAAESGVESRSLRNLQVLRDLGVIVRALCKAGGEMFFNPSADSTISVGDHLIAIGAAPALRRLEALAGQHQL